MNQEKKKIGGGIQGSIRYCARIRYEMVLSKLITIRLRAKTQLPRKGIETRAADLRLTQ